MHSRSMVVAAVALVFVTVTLVGIGAVSASARLPGTKVVPRVLTCSGKTEIEPVQLHRFLRRRERHPAQDRLDLVDADISSGARHVLSQRLHARLCRWQVPQLPRHRHALGAEAHEIWRSVQPPEGRVHERRQAALVHSAAAASAALASLFQADSSLLRSGVQAWPEFRGPCRPSPSRSQGGVRPNLPSSCLDGAGHGSPAREVGVSGERRTHPLEAEGEGLCPELWCDRIFRLRAGARQLSLAVPIGE